MASVANEFTGDDGACERMHVVTAQFTIVLDGEVPIADELEGLGQALQNGAYEHPAMPNGSWRIVSVGPEEDHRDIDPCWDDAAQVPA